MAKKQINLPKGVHLPHGVSVAQAKKGLEGAMECSKLVDDLLKDSGYADLISGYIRDHADRYPVLVTAI